MNIVHWVRTLGIVLLFQFQRDASFANALLVQNLQKIYTSKDWWGKIHTTTVLQNVSFNIDAKIICIIGPSLAGKSTLAKCCAGLESPTNGTIHLHDGTGQKPNGVYLTNLFRMTYDESKSCHQILQEVQPPNNPLIDTLLENLDFKIFGHSRVSGLLESQRQVFEIILGICRLREPTSILLVLDEYLDKTASVVRKKTISKLQQLGRHPDFNLRVLVPTHSRGVLEDCGSPVIIMKDGRIFDTNNNFQKLVFPKQLNLIE